MGHMQHLPARIMHQESILIGQKTLPLADIDTPIVSVIEALSIISFTLKVGKEDQVAYYWS
jgi:hypothetical protein